MLRFALFGCGRIGRMHAANLAKHPRTELVSVFDVFAEAAEQTAKATGAKVAPTVDDILNGAGVDAVLIASSTDTHVDLLTRSAKAQKAILCEKPIDLDLARVDTCWAEIGSLDPLIMIGFNRRFDPSFKALRDRVRNGEIGKLEQLSITSRDPGPPPADYIKVSGGMFRDMTIHDFDIARYIAGDVVAVHAVGANLVEPEIEELGDIDAAMITMEAANGALIHINNSRRSTYGYDQRLEAFGELGMLQAGNHRATSVSYSGKDATETRDPVLHFFIERYKAAYIDEVNHFVDCVEQRKKPLVNFSDGREALRLAEAAYESMRNGKTVRLD